MDLHHDGYKNQSIRIVGAEPEVDHLPRSKKPRLNFLARTSLLRPIWSVTAVGIDVYI